MIRNIIAYPLPHVWPHTATDMAVLMQRRQFQPCGALDMVSHGFVPPREDSGLCEHIAGRHVFCHQHEEKILPASVINEYVEIKCEEIEQHQGYKPGRKQRKGIKEQVVAELLPQAFAKKRRALAWVNPVRRWLIIEATSAKRAEDVLSDMRHALDNQMPVELLRTEASPARVMLDWLAAHEAPERFSIDRDCELVSFAEDEGVVRYSNWDLAGDDVRYQLSIGRAPTLLGLTFDDRVSFILTNRLELKRILLLDVVTTGREEADDELAKFDADITLAAEEIELALEALVDVMGGLVVTKRDDLVEQAQKAIEKMAEYGSATFTGVDGEAFGIGNDLDPIYHDAKRVVLTEGRASTTALQRCLKIGYSRAARLIEQMEADGIVSEMKADGSREVLAA